MKNASFKPWTGWQWFFGCALVLVALGAGPTMPNAAAATLTFAVGGASGQTGSQVLIPVSVTAFSDINSFQFSFHWPTNIATFVDVEQFGLTGLAGGNFGILTNAATLTNAPSLTVSWDDPGGTSQTVPDGTTIFAVRLLLAGPAGSSGTNLINSTPTAIDAANGNLDAVSVSILPGALTIAQPNTPPVLRGASDQAINEGSALTFTVSATDGEVPPQTLTFSLDPGAPAGAGIDSSSGQFSWTPSEAQGPSTNSVTIRVTDSGVPAMSDSRTITIIVNEVNTAPVLLPIGNKTVFQGQLFSFTPTVNDADLPPQALAFSLGAGAPAGAAVDAATGLFSWSPPRAVANTSSAFKIIVSDNGTPSLSATQSFTVTALKTNSAPVFSPLNSYLAEVLIPLHVTNAVVDLDMPANSFTFQIADAPKGVRINKYTGVVTWAPTKSQARSTNSVSVVATDDGVPPLSATNTFEIAVDDYLELSLGRTVVRAGQTGSVAVTATNTTGVTNLSASLFAPSAHVTGLGITGLAPEIAAGTVQPQGAGLANLNFRTTSGQILQPGQVVGQLSFTALATQSVFVPLIISNVVSIQANGASLTRSLASPGRVVVVANEPLVEALTPTNSQPLLVLYGVPGTTYTVQAATDPHAPSGAWQPVWHGTLTNLFQVIQPAGSADAMLFFRAQ